MNTTYESIEQMLDNSSRIYKSKPSIIRGIALILLGIVLIVLNGKITDAPNSIISPVFIIAGIALLAWGVFSLFFRKTSYRSAKTKQPVTFYEAFYDIKERDNLVRIISGGSVSELARLKKSAQDALKLRVAATDAGDICCTQVAAYVPFEFVNVTAVKEHNADEAAIIKEAVKRG